MLFVLLSIMEICNPIQYIVYHRFPLEVSTRCGCQILIRKVGPRTIVGNMFG